MRAGCAWIVDRPSQQVLAQAQSLGVCDFHGGVNDMSRNVLRNASATLFSLENNTS